jgi:hypothetical protein
MDKKKPIEQFYVGLQAKNHMEQCPFLVEWFNSKVEELNKFPDQFGRSGIARGKQLPIPKAKYLLALHDVVFKKLPLKQFCELLEINHGTGRNWRNTDKIFQEIAGEFMEGLSKAFLRRYGELVESEKPESFSHASRLIKECRHYSNGVVGLIIAGLGRYGKKKTEGTHPIDSWVVIHSHHLLSSALLLSLENTDSERRKYAQSLLDNEAMMEDSFFENLREKYKSPEAQTAIMAAEMRAGLSTRFYTTILKEFIG